RLAAVDAGAKESPAALPEHSKRYMGRSEITSSHWFQQRSFYQVDKSFPRSRDHAPVWCKAHTSGPCYLSGSAQPVLGVSYSPGINPNAGNGRRSRTKNKRALLWGLWLTMSCFCAVGSRSHCRASRRGRGGKYLPFSRWLSPDSEPTRPHNP